MSAAAGECFLAVSNLGSSVTDENRSHEECEGCSRDRCSQRVFYDYFQVGFSCSCLSADKRLVPNFFRPMEVNTNSLVQVEQTEYFH
jgi:hypothetical protein